MLCSSPSPAFTHLPSPHRCRASSPPIPPFSTRRPKLGPGCRSLSIFRTSPGRSGNPACARPCVCRATSISTSTFEKVPILLQGDAEVLEIRVSARPYPVYIGRGILYDSELLRRHINGKHVLIITNNELSRLYLDGLVMAIKSIARDINVEAICLDDGEESKNQRNVAEVINAAVKVGMDNTTTFVGLGGGVINNICGFSAACYQGGVNYIQIPTTFRAQVDLSVADEAGIYHLLDKQSICSYYEPECVIVDIDTLETLPGKELLSGIVETIKLSLVRDGNFLQWLKTNMTQLLERHPVAVAYAIKRCCMIKAEVLREDRRANLTLGQPFGHALLRSMELRDGLLIGQKQQKWVHGEGLSVGIVMAVDFSHRLGWIDDLVLMDAVIAMERAHLPTAPPAHISKADLKQNINPPNQGSLKLALLKGGAGECIFTEDYDPQVLESVFAFFCLGDKDQ